MDAGTLHGIVAGWASALATLLVARYGGTFRRRRSLALRFGGYPLVNGRPLAIVYGVPGSRTPVVACLPLEIANLGEDTVEGVTVTAILPQLLGGFVDEKTKKPIVQFVRQHGPDIGISSQVERVGIYHHLHMMVETINPLVSVGVDIPVGFPGATGNIRIPMPVTFKDGIKANLEVVTTISIPIDLLVTAKDQRTQHFTINIETYAPPERGFYPLMTEWLYQIFAGVETLTSLSMKVRFWLRIILKVHRCFLVAPTYREVTVGGAGK